MIGGFQSDLSITYMIDGNFVNVSAGVLCSKVAYHENSGNAFGYVHFLYHYVGTFSRPLYEVVTNETFYINFFSYLLGTRTARVS